MHSILPFQVRKDARATTRKTKVMVVVTAMVVDMAAEEVVTISHKPMMVPTPKRKRA